MTTALDALAAKREQLKKQYLKAAPERIATSGRGVHHIAALSSDVERTIHFYQDIVGFPLVELFENRDYKGSTHFFFDIGHGNQLAFFDFPGLGLGPYAEVLGGWHHLAISVEPEAWEAARGRLTTAGIPFEVISGTSMYFSDPDGTRLELLAEPLGQMYGSSIG